MSNRCARAVSDATSAGCETLESRVLLCDPHMMAHLPEPPQWSDAVEARARAAQLQEGGPEATVINWTNRNQASDGFNATFGTRAEQMRGIVDAALLAWQQVITNWNRSDGSITLQVSINVSVPGSGFGGAGGPSSSAPSASQAVGRTDMNSEISGSVAKETSCDPTTRRIVLVFTGLVAL